MSIIFFSSNAHSKVCIPSTSDGVYAQTMSLQAPSSKLQALLNEKATKLAFFLGLMLFAPWLFQAQIPPCTGTFTPTLIIPALKIIVNN